MRRLILAMIVLMAAAVSVEIGFARPAFACSCAGPHDEAAFGQAAAVFVGELQEIRGPTVRIGSGSERRLIYSVSAVFKGDVFATQSVATKGDGPSCGLDGEVGVSYLVFGGTSAAYPGVPDAGEYGGALCDGTRRVDAAPLAFGPGVLPRPGSSPIGQDDFIGSRLVRNWHWFALGVLGICGGLVLLLRRGRSVPRGE
jgi:hypothetical protein